MWTREDNINMHRRKDYENGWCKQLDKGVFKTGFGTHAVGTWRYFTIGLIHLMLNLKLVHILSRTASNDSAKKYGLILQTSNLGT
jgi:hypothetical protein